MFGGESIITHNSVNNARHKSKLFNTVDVSSLSSHPHHHKTTLQIDDQARYSSQKKHQHLIGKSVDFGALHHESHSSGVAVQNALSNIKRTRLNIDESRQLDLIDQDVSVKSIKRAEASHLKELRESRAVKASK